MRRIGLAAVAAVLALAVFAVPASARIDHHFSVDTKEVSFHGDGDSFRLHEALYAPGTDVQVGNDRVRCHEVGRKFKCRAVINLNGRLGGAGSLFVNGNIGRGDSRLNIVGGTGDFAGAAGKVIATNRLHFDLVR
jgi:hypothetical protein